MLLAHIDVVEAKREDWERDPFTLVEEDGFFYARGASDDKAMAAVVTDILVRFQREGFKPRRTVKLALTCGEETPATFNSVAWLLKTHPDVLKAKFVLNEGAGGLLAADGKHLALDIQAGEKVYQDFALETTNSRRTQRKAGQGQRDQPACGRSHAARSIPVSHHLEPDDARLFRSAGWHGVRRKSAARHPRRAREPPGCGGGGSFVGHRSGLERHDADHVHRDPDRGRPRAECTATAGAGQRQLPDPARRPDRGDAGGPEASHGGRRHQDQPRPAIAAWWPPCRLCRHRSWSP